TTAVAFPHRTSLLLLDQSASWQVSGTQLLHPLLSSSFIFNFRYESTFSFFFDPSIGTIIRSSNIFSLRLPTRAFPNNLPSNTSLNNPFPLSTCPTQFFFLWRIVSIKHLDSFTIVKTSSLLILSLQFTFSNFLHSHISSASNLSFSSFFSVHVSHPYIATGHTNTLTILFFNVPLNPPVKNSFLLLNASFANAILVLTSIRHLPSSEMRDPKYLKFET